MKLKCGASEPMETTHVLYFEGRDSLVNLVIFSTHSNVFHCSSTFRIVFQDDYHEPSTQYPLLQKPKANFQTRKALELQRKVMILKCLQVFHEFMGGFPC